MGNRIGGLPIILLTSFDRSAYKKSIQNWRNIVKLRTYLSTFVLATGYLHADINDGDISQEKIPTDTSDKPFQIAAYGDSISKAKFSNKCLDDEGVRYGHVGVEGIFAFYGNSCFGEAAYFEADLSQTLIRWKENPYFSQEDFNCLSLSLGGFTERATGWKLWAEIDVNIDTDHACKSDYYTYDGFLWGRYNYSETLGIHVGFLGETGMKIDRVYPILGVDWQAMENLKLNLVFPLNISAVYMIDDCLAVAVAARFFQSRFRVGEDEPVPRGLVCYRSVGIEFAVSHTLSWIQSNVHIGYNTGGILKVANRHYENRHRFKFKSAPYYGGEVRVLF